MGAPISYRKKGITRFCEKNLFIVNCHTMERSVRQIAHLGDCPSCHEILLLVAGCSILAS